MSDICATLTLHCIIQGNYTKTIYKISGWSIFVFLCVDSIQTIIVVVQTVEHESELFFVSAQILGEFLKVQLSIMVGITHTHYLQEWKALVRQEWEVRTRQDKEAVVKEEEAALKGISETGMVFCKGQRAKQVIEIVWHQLFENISIFIFHN